MYCRNCGKEINDNADVCVNCGVFVLKDGDQPNSNSQQDPFFPYPPQQQNPPDAPSSGYVVLGAFFWYIGLILYLVWKDTYPLRAGSCLKGMKIGLCIMGAGIFLNILLFACMVATADSSFLPIISMALKIRR